MQRLRYLSNKFQKRLIRPLYGQTQAYPYAATLDPAFRAADGSLVLPTAGNDASRAADAFTLQSGIVPGTVMVLSAGVASAPSDSVKVGVGATDENAFGLLANFVGGNLDELGDENTVGVWRGPDGVFELLAPAFNPSGLVSAWTSRTTGSVVPLFIGSDGRLTVTKSTKNLAGSTVTAAGIPVANLIDVAGSAPSRIVVDFKV